MSKRMLIDCRKHCAACKCPRDVHDVTHKESVNVQDRLGLNREPEEPVQLDHHHHHHPAHHNHPAGGALQASSRAMPLNKAPRPTSSDVYSWIPAGLAPERVSRTRALRSPPPPPPLVCLSLPLHSLAETFARARVLLFVYATSKSCAEKRSVSVAFRHLFIATLKSLPGLWTFNNRLH